MTPVAEQQDVAYEERLTAPLWVWAAVLAVAGVSAAALHGGAPGWRAVVPYAVLLPVAVAGLLWVSRGRVRVADGVLHVPGARIPLDHLLGGIDKLERKLERARSGQKSGASGALATFEITRPFVGASALGIAQCGAARRPCPRRRGARRR